MVMVNLSKTLLNFINWLTLALWNGQKFLFAWNDAFKVRNCATRLKLVFLKAFLHMLAGQTHTRERGRLPNDSRLLSEICVFLKNLNQRTFLFLAPLTKLRLQC